MIERIEEDRIGVADTSAVLKLLSDSFPGFFTDRPYVKQLPHFRLLAREAGHLIGHVAIVLRAARCGDIPIRIFGLVDLCVAEGFRNRGVGAELTAAAIDAARQGGADFLLAFADDPRLYRAVGFTRRSNPCTWLAIDEHRTLGVKTDALADCLMVLPLGGMAWREDVELDLLGHLF